MKSIVNSTVKKRAPIKILDKSTNGIKGKTFNFSQFNFRIMNRRICDNPIPVIKNPAASAIVIQLTSSCWKSNPIVISAPQPTLCAIQYEIILFNLLSFALGRVPNNNVRDIQNITLYFCLEILHP